MGMGVGMTMLIYALKYGNPGVISTLSSTMPIMIIPILWIVTKNYAGHLAELRRFREAKILFRKVIPVARRVLGEHNITVFRMRWVYAQTLYTDDDATPNDRREGITTLEETERTARRVLGGSHPLVAEIQKSLRDVQAAVRDVQAALRARETQPPRTFAPGWLDGPS